MPEKPMNTQEIFEEAKIVHEEVEKARTESNFEETKKRIFNPLMQVDYRNEKLEAAEGENKFSFSMAQFSASDKALVSEHIKKQKFNGRLSGLFTEVGNWGAVDQLHYSLGQNNFDIFGLLPEGYKILFCPNSEKNCGSVIISQKIIIIEGDLMSPGTLAIILHEIGHVKDDEKLKKIGKNKLVEGGDWEENEKAEELRKEREASYFAIRKMWLLLREYPQLKSDIILFLKNICYFSYCDPIVKEIKENTAMRKRYEEEMDRHFDDFDYDNDPYS